MDSAIVKDAIANYIQENWLQFYNMKENVVVDYEGDSNYTAICTYYKQGYGSDTRGRIIITFKDVIPASDEEFPDELWFSAYVDVVSCKIDALDTAHPDDLLSFAEFSNEMYKCLSQIYSELPANENDRFDFYARNY